MERSDAVRRGDRTAHGIGSLSTIVHVTAPATFGGLERVVAGLAAATVDRGQPAAVIAVLTPAGALPAWLPPLEETGVHVVTLRVGARQYLRELQQVRAAAEGLGASLLHTHGYRSDILHLNTAHALGIPVVSTAHGFASTGGKGRFYEWLQVRAWRRFDAVVAVSRPLLDTLATAGVPRVRLEFIRNGLGRATAPLPRALARRELGLPADAALVGWVGRLSEEKDPVLAVEALARIGDQRPQLCFIGDGPLQGSVAARAAELGLTEAVTFVGPKPSAGRLLAAFDALLLSSRTEGTPMVLIEAALANVPIVATAVGGVPDLVGDAAALAPAGDAEALGKAIGQLLTEPAAARAKAERLRARLERSEAEDDWVGQYLALYKRLQAR